MSRFWPEGLSLNDTQSPYEILENAREQWEEASEGVFTLMLQQEEDIRGIEMTIIVHAKHIPSDRTATLFSVIHRLNVQYPVVINPVDDYSIPLTLRKSYSLAGINDPWNKSETVTNKWVSDTPSEFRKKLEEVFNLSNVKATVLSLTSGVQK